MKKLLLSTILVATIAHATGPVHVNSAAQFDQILRDNQNVIVDFYADWCGPCKRFAPTFSQLAGEYSNIMFVKVNIDHVSALKNRYGIRSIPTMLFFKNSSVVKRISGSKSKSKFKKDISSAF